MDIAGSRYRGCDRGRRGQGPRRLRPADCILPLAALLTAVVAAAAAAGAWHAGDYGGGGPGAPLDPALVPQALYGQLASVGWMDADWQDDLLPRAHGYVHYDNEKVIGPNKFQIHWDIPMGDMRGDFNNPTFSPGGERHMTGMTGHVTRMHTYTVDGSPLPPFATGRVAILEGTFYSPPGHGHEHVTWYDIYINLVDGQAPRLDTSERIVLDLTEGILTFKSNEALRAGTFSPHNVRIGGVAHTHSLSSGTGVQIDTIGRAPYTQSNVKITLTPGDHEAIELDLASRTTTTTKIVNPGLYDAAGNQFGTGRWWQAVNIVHDTTPPELSGPPKLDFNTGVLTIKFNERVLSFYMPYLYLEDRNGGSHQHVSGASRPSPLDTATVPITLTRSQLERLATMYLSTGGLRLDMHTGIAADPLGNRFAAVHNREIDVVRDTTKPELAAGRVPAVDLAHHHVSLTFNERMDASETRAAGVRLHNSTDRSGGVVLSGESVRGGDGHTVSLTLSHLNKARIADLGTPLYVSFAADAFKDVWGNAAAASPPSGIRASTGADWIRPGIVRGAQSLDMNNGTLTVVFTEAVYTERVYTRGYALHVADPSNPAQRTTVGLDGAGVATAERFADAVDIRLTGAQKAAVASAGGPSPSVLVTIGGWAYQDYPVGNHGWYVPAPGFGVTVADDATPPRNTTAPVLDLDAGTLAIEFDEYIDASAFDPSGMLILRSDGGPPIQIGNSTLSPADDGARVVVNMTGAGAAEARAADDMDHVDLTLTVPATAFSDMSGNRFLGLTNATVAEAGGAGYPVLAGSGAGGAGGGPNPVLDLRNGTLEIRFDRGVAVPSDLAGIAIASPDGRVRVGLAGADAGAVGQYSPNVTITLAPPQKALLAAEHARGGRLAIDVAHSVFAPEHGRYFAGLSNATLGVVDDDRAPDLAGGPSIDLRARTITISFDEYVNLTSVDAGGFLVHDGTGAVAGPLAGAAVSSPDGALYGAELVLTMTPLQGFSAIRAALGGDTLYLNVSGSAVHDVSGNPYAGLDTSDRGGAPAGAGSSMGGTRQSAADPSDAAPPSGGPVPAKGPGSAPLPLLPLPLLPPLPQDGTRQALGANIVPSDPPQLAAVPSPVRLDLNTGVLEVEFDQVVNLPATNLTGAAIRGAGIAVPLEGAAVPAPGFGLDSTVVVRLTAAQKAGAVAAGPAALLHLPAGFASLFDPSAAVQGARIAVTADGTPPSLDAGRTVLDLGTGRLVAAYDEYVAGPPGGLDAGALAIAVEGGERVQLAGASAAAVSNDTVVVSLAPPQKAGLDRAAAGNASAQARLDATAGAVLDLSANPAGRISAVNVSVAPDARPPALDGTPILNLGTGTLALTFDEFVAADGLAPGDVAVTDRNGNAAESPSLAAPATAGDGDGSGIDGTRLVLEFSPAQAGSLRAANASAGPLRIAVAGGVIADLSGNAFGGLPGNASGTLVMVDDSVPPALAPETVPALDIGSGIVSMMFTEHVPASGIDLSGAAIEDANGANRVPLSGALVVPPSGPEVRYRTVEDDSLRIFLTADQKGAVARAHQEAGPVRLDLPSAAISDAAGLRFAGLSNAPLAISEDEARPEIRERTLPSLDIAHGLLTVPFDEYVDAAGADLAGFELSGRPSGSAENASVPLAGASLASELDGAELRVRVAPSQLAALVGGGLTGIPPSVYLTIAPGAVRDVSGNAFAGLDGELIEALADEAPPALPAPPVVDLDSGTVVISFDEYVAATLLNASGVSLVGSGRVLRSTLLGRREPA